MPELPEVAALTSFVAENGGGQKVSKVSVSALGLLATVEPAPAALVGATLTATTRHGKFLDFQFSPSSSRQADRPIHLVLFLARAGWLRWSDALSSVMPKMGGPIAMRLWFENGSGFDLTEAGSRKSMTLWLVKDPLQVPGVAALGPDALTLTLEQFADLMARSPSRVKNVITDQRSLAGIGNAYSDEILHTAMVSPFAVAKKLTDDAVARLYASMRSVLITASSRLEGQEAARLKGEKRSGMRVHGMFGLPCPVCGDTVAQVEFADKSLQYCPTCQTGGRKLADRGMSRLLT
ncbi:Fpg/Nei family DNA glycosylase [Nakamurella antarctica]|uniref:Fpg/Nei family DNA glycosylase n=1 Tax=Nakamurella antarctica TaxID=1902245 RepID=A0A3G8ZWH0_9ACTN|nr:DNA-formamidopyrimidine glycosylase family protein [Nakamurella antarctica]AZI58021.1 Fpg/Nei family DNA glycosylase [Nakamurella antarctica]